MGGREPKKKKRRESQKSPTADKLFFLQQKLANMQAMFFTTKTELETCIDTFYNSFHKKFFTDKMNFPL